MGFVEALHVARQAGGAMEALAAVEVVPGRGLNGDRYARGVGFYSGLPTDPGAREVTLFEAEVLESLRDEHGIAFTAAEHRRNVTTCGVRLADLVGRRFLIGDVELEGVRDCPPCDHLQQITGKAVLQPLVGRGGLRARVVRAGLLRVNDPIVIELPVATT